MVKLNQNFDKMKDSYLFAKIADKTAAYKKENPTANLIRMGIGDVTLPLCEAVIEAGKAACEEMGRGETFRGYGPYEGYDFLIDAIHGYYLERGVTLNKREIFVSDGAKSDLGNILELFDGSNRVLIPDPVYPAYLDSNVMMGHSVLFADATADNGFLPMPDDAPDCDIIYICSPNNPTGAVYSNEQLEKWVEFANKKHALILFDAAYEYFVSQPGLVRSIYEIEGAKTCAIEVCSLSKTAGFTGTRCGYTIIPEELGKLNRMWFRRQSTKYNGVPYIVQRMAAAVFSPAGREQVEHNIAVYRSNARCIAKTMDELGIFYTGGINSPYIWLKVPGGDSWKFFDALLYQANVVGTPGEGFGKNGEGFFRLTAFNTPDNTREAMRRFSEFIKEYS